ncbi:MAG: hypothetical protein JW820_14040, partial [Spirochaetales bacterium]|nr:hypothetical protein [Spirochaetales bacterium]
GAERFLQKVLTNDAAALKPGRAQYTMIPTPTGGALDDAYLYCLGHEEYLLVVNASNREKDWEFLQAELGGARGAPITGGTRGAGGVERLTMEDRSEELAMLSLQGPDSPRIVLGLAAAGGGSAGDRLAQGRPTGQILPESGRNNLCAAVLDGVPLTVARTGYTGEPLGFELFVPAREAGRIWDRLLEGGAFPMGLGARDTLRLEAALPLYGHELGADAEGREIPIFACPLARFAVSLSPHKGEFIGREAIMRQAAAYRSITAGRPDPDALAVLPRLVRLVSLLDKGIARQGVDVFSAGGESGAEARGGAAAGAGRPVGRVTSGTMAPYWVFAGEGPAAAPTEGSDKRAIALALLDSSLAEGQVVEADIRGRRSRGLIVPHFLRSQVPPYARPVLWGQAG